MSIKINGVNKDSTIEQVSTISRGAYHLADNPDLYEAQRQNNFEFIVHFGANEVLRKVGNNVPTGENSYYTGSNAQEILRLSVSSADIPFFSQKSLEIRRGNNILKYAGVPEFRGGKITVRDFIGADTKGILLAWQAKSYNVKTEKVGLASDYKKDCELFELTPDHQVVRSWILRGCWISELSEGGYNSENNNLQDIDVSIEYDSAIVDYNAD